MMTLLAAARMPDVWAAASAWVPVTDLTAWHAESTGRRNKDAARPVLLRRTSGSVRLTVFDGGHEILHEAALTWLEAQRRNAPPQWSPTPHQPRVLQTSATESGR